LDKEEKKRKNNKTNPKKDQTKEGRNASLGG